MKTPQNVSFLERGICSLVDSNDKAYRLRVLMADVIVGQYLDGAVMRGGGALKLRYGNAVTRFTLDFDAARNIEADEFEQSFSRRLQDGWNGFSGRLVKMPKAHPLPSWNQNVYEKKYVRFTDEQIAEEADRLSREICPALVRWAAKGGGDCLVNRASRGEREEYAQSGSVQK